MDPAAGTARERGDMLLEKTPRVNHMDVLNWDCR